MDKGMLAQKLLQTTYKKRIFRPFVRAIKEFNLIEDGDKIAVCISGGKDSFLLAKLFQILHEYGNKNFEVKFLSMDPGYLDINRNLVLENAKELGIELTVVNKQVFKAAYEMDNNKPCFMCARMRRGILYDSAKKMGCNKIALGHHYDDAIETIMMNVLSCGTYMTMMPKLKSKNFEDMELIRPLIYVRERNIVAFRNQLDLKFLDCACEVSRGDKPSNRARVKALIKELSKTFPNVENSIFASSKNVEIDAILGYKEKGRHISFLDKY